MELISGMMNERRDRNSRGVNDYSTLDDNEITILISYKLSSKMVAINSKLTFFSSRKVVIIICFERLRYIFQ